MSDFPTRLFIDGKWTQGSQGKPRELINPATGDVFVEVECAAIFDLDRAVESADLAFRRVWRDLKPVKRSEILFAMAGSIRRHKETLAILESRNIGKPISDARDEIEMGARTFEYYAGAVSRLTGQTIPVAGGGFDFTLRQPMGVVAAIVPWNFPFPIACWKVAPALASGNTVVLKPASLSPLTALFFGVVAEEAELPPGVLQVLNGPGSVLGDRLVTHPLVRKISFTGSTEVGRHIMALAAHGIKRVSLELGGKSPNIVFADADLDLAANQSPMSVFANTGQDCCARSRVFVEEKVYQPFLEQFIESTQAIKIGDPLNPETQIGPMISSSQRESVERYLAMAAKDECPCHIGGGRGEGPGFYLNPAVLTGVPYDHPVWMEEIFGPVVCITPFSDETEMMELVNASPYGLSASVWTRDIARALRVARAIESGVVSINTHSSVHLEAPFGGMKESGLGRDLGMSALEGYTELKNVYVAP